MVSAKVSSDMNLAAITETQGVRLALGLRALPTPRMGLLFGRHGPLWEEEVRGPETWAPGDGLLISVRAPCRESKKSESLKMQI